MSKKGGYDIASLIGNNTGTLDSGEASKSYLVVFYVCYFYVICMLYVYFCQYQPFALN